MTVTPHLVRRTLYVKGYRIDLRANLDLPPAVFHYVISTEDSAEILTWGQARTAEDAREEAQRVVEYYLESAQPKKA